MTARIFVNAVALHSGGGLTLLREFARAATRHIAVAAIDDRLALGDRDLFTGASVRFVPPTLAARIAASLALAKTACAGDVLFSFASLPPLRRTAARSIVYVHAPYLAGLKQSNAASLPVTARHKFEKVWFALAARNADVFWVQTESMSRALRQKLPGATIRTLPFIATEMTDRLAARKFSAPQAVERRYFYPADAVAHKNHANLLRAWSTLADEGFCPRLDLTLTADEFAQAAAEAQIRSGVMPQIVNLGRLSHADVLAKFAAGDSLVFPSLTETFGLPLIEAAAAGAPLVIAERDYARDVVSADESFDPASPRSIADAIRRHMGCPRQPPIPFDAAHLVAELLG